MAGWVALEEWKLRQPKLKLKLRLSLAKIIDLGPYKRSGVGYDNGGSINLTILEYHMPHVAL